MIASALATPIACAAAACTNSTEKASSPDAPDLSADAASVLAAPADVAIEAGCSSGALSLIVSTERTSSGMSPSRLFVPAQYRSSAAAFLLDTGSPFTFLHEPLSDAGGPPAMTPDAGSVVLGCDTLTLDGFPVVDTPPVDGKTVVGTFGDDRLLGRTVKVDITGQKVLWRDPGADDPFPEAASWPSTSYDRPRGYVRLHDVAFDGTPVELLLDTGSPDSLWLGQDGKPGDTVVEGEDSAGNSFKMYLGTVVVSIGDFQETVPVYRVPSFPYVEGLADMLGGHLNGLFGLSAFPHGVVFDTDEHRVRVAP